MSTSSRSTLITGGMIAGVIIGLLTSLLASTSVASGGTGGLSGLGGGGSAPRRQVDESYEYGKAVYLGRTAEAPKLKYCVLVDGEAKKVKKRTLKPYRKKTQVELANALYRCDDPTQLALKSLKQEQIAFVLYYLNKRFKLQLAGI